VPADQHPALARDELVRAVEAECLDGGLPGRGQPDDEQPVIAPAEVIVPALGVRVVEADDLAALGVARLGLGALALIAVAARAS
jgi:hypothetical protein